MGPRNSNTVYEDRYIESSSSSSPSLNHEYYYGKSFILAVLAFLSSEISAVLCLYAFLNKFDSEEEFVKIIPGMERKMLQHSVNYYNSLESAMDDHHLMKGGGGGGGVGVVPSSGNGGSLQQVGHSFGLRAPTQTASEESLYGLQHRMVVSESATSILRSSGGSSNGGNGGQTLTAAADIAICPPPPPRSSSIADDDIDIRGDVDMHDIQDVKDLPDLEVPASPPPPPSAKIPTSAQNGHHSMTLPRLDMSSSNGYNNRMHYNFAELNPPRTAQIKKGPPPIRIDQNGGSGSNGGGSGGGGGSTPSSSSSSRTAIATATMPRNGSGIDRKKKSVTIGTFTTVETFDFNSSAVWHQASNGTNSEDVSGSHSNYDHRRTSLPNAQAAAQALGGRLNGVNKGSTEEMTLL